MDKFWIKAAQRLLTATFVLFTGAAFAAQSTTSTFPNLDEPSGAGGWKPHVGVMAGYANPEGNYDATAEYGLDIGFQPYIPFGYGAELTTLSSDGPRGEDLDRTKLLLKASYNFGGTNELFRVSYLGVAAGPVWDSIGSEDSLNLGVAPMAGFDYPIGTVGRGNRQLSLGANAKYLIVGANLADTFSLNGMMKYWF